jgi:hypothetical protein
LGNDSALALSTGAASITGTLAVSSTSAFGGNMAINGSANSLDINPTTGQPNITLRSGNTFRGYIEGNASGGLSFVGIGTNAPDYELQVGDGTATETINIKALNTNPSRIFFSDADAIGQGRIHYEHGGDYMNFWTDNSEKMRITSAGDVGIGTTTSSYDTNKIGSNHRFLNVQAGAGLYAVGTLAGNQSVNGDRLGYLAFVNDNNSASYKYSAWLGSEVDGTTTNQQGGRLIFSTTGDGSSAGPIERMRITQAGNVGIGTDAPTATLNIKATASNNSDNLAQVLTNSEFRLQYRADDISSLYIGGLGSEKGFLQGVNAAQNAGADISLNPYGGNVGIGTSTPAELLHLSTNLGGSTGVGTAIHIESSGAGGDQAFIGVNKGAGNGLEISVENRDIIFNTGATTPFGGTERMRILSAGNVGIGTDAPSVKTEISGSASGDFAALALTNTNQAGTADAATLNFKLGRSVDSFLFTVPAIKFVKEQQWTSSGPTVDGALVFSTIANESTSEKMRITSAGNVGIGTSVPTATLDVGGEIKLSSDLYMGNGRWLRFDRNSGSTSIQTLGIPTGTDDVRLLTTGDFNLVTGSLSNLLTVKQAGNVGIGTDAPATTLDVLGTSFLRGNVNAGKTANINVTTAVNGVGGGNREFDTFTGASATGFTGTDAADQGHGYFAATIVSGRSYEVSATMVVTNGAPLSFITSTGLNFATDTVQTVQGSPVSGTTYRFVASGNASYFGISASNSGGGMTCVVSNFSLKEVGSVLVTSDSNVGVGTTAPAVKLDVVGNIRTSSGVLFGSDTAAANMLDDYEEGTWTMGVSFGGASVGVTYNANAGKYTKIGRQVTVTGYMNLTSKGSSTGNAEITGLPFAQTGSVQNYSSASVYMVSVTFANQFTVIGLSGTNLALYEITEAGVASLLNDADFANNSEVLISYTYFVS